MAHSGEFGIGPKVLGGGSGTWWPVALLRVCFIPQEAPQPPLHPSQDPLHFSYRLLSGFWIVLVTGFTTAMPWLIFGGQEREVDVFQLRPSLAHGDPRQGFLSGAARMSHGVLGRPLVGNLLLGSLLLMYLLLKDTGMK